MWQTTDAFTRVVMITLPHPSHTHGPLASQRSAVPPIRGATALQQSRPRRSGRHSELPTQTVAVASS